MRKFRNDKIGDVSSVGDVPAVGDPRPRGEVGESIPVISYCRQFPLIWSKYIH